MTDANPGQSAQPQPRSRSRRTALRWAAPLAAIAVVAGGTFGVNTLADADPGLPTTSPEQLVTDVLTATVPGMSGTVSSTVQLGLPDLGSLGGGRDSGQPSVMDWLSGTHTVRVWQAGEDKQRLSVPDGDSEYGVYRNGSTTWLWSSEGRKATKVVTTGEATAPRPPTGTTPPTPQEAAKQLLTEVGTTSTVSLATNVTVANRSAYELVLTPKQAGTKIARVEIAVDGATKVPLRVEVFAAGASTAAVSVGFSAVDFTVPADSVFAFTPPPGTTVETKTIDPKAAKKTDEKVDKKADKKIDKKAGAADHQVVGSGWLTVLVGSGVTMKDLSDQPAAQQVLATLPRVKGAWGSGVLFEGPLFSAVLTDNGRFAVGAVVPDQLYAALG